MRARALGLLDTDVFVQEAVLHGMISARHARAIKQLPEKFLQYKLVDIAIDWKLSADETRGLIKQVKEGKPLIYWTRDVPTDSIGLYKERMRHQADQKLVNKLMTDGQMRNVGVFIPGIILYGLEEYLAAQANGRPSIRADIFYPVDYLIDRGFTGYPVTRLNVKNQRTSMFPSRSDAKRARCKKFANRLEEIIIADLEQL